jgi:ATP-dependent Clp protease ATP-binding subunit ClpA
VFERFTAEARQVVVVAQEEARAGRAAEVGPVHLLQGVAAAGGPGGAVLADAGATADRLREQVRGAAAPAPGTLDADALAALGIDLDRVRAAAEAAFGAGALDAGRPGATGSGRVRFAARSRTVLEQSLRAALRRGDRRIGTEHVLAGVLAVGDPVVGAVLTRLGVDPEGLRRRLDGEAAA